MPAQPPRDDAEPYEWWGFGWDVPDPLSRVDLVAAGNVDARTAALLWLLIEARASIVVAADPQAALTPALQPSGHRCRASNLPPKWHICPSSTGPHR